jgi:alpha-glucosidase
MSERFVWWKHGVFYQVYPRSFMDSNGDGIGDLQGIIDRLDYLVELGVDAIWISPIYPSPMADFGYDISDYIDIHPMFGDMDTFDRLLQEAHKRNLHIVLDYVPNHTSDQHPWFIESRSSRDNPKRDWYIWRNARSDGGPPNNWESLFGGSAWEWDQKTKQYYLHLFLKEQPDLNWRNPEVVEAMHDVLRFWLDKGVDGFRMDVVMLCIKHPDFPDNPPAEDSPFAALVGLSQDPIYYMGRPEVHDMIREFRRIFDSYKGDRVIIGETVILDPAELVKYYGENLDEIHIPFNFINLICPWKAREVEESVKAYYAVVPEGATPNFVFGNHDFHRLATRFGPENHRAAGMLLLTLWGIPTMYYGDELGMEDVPVPPERMQDPWGINKPELNVGRDPERTPMQWDASPNAGFASEGVETWLPVAEDYREVNVAVQCKDPASTLNFYKRLLKLRREMPALYRGDFAFVEGVPEDVIAYTRSVENQRVLVVVNFGGNAHILDVSAVARPARTWGAGTDEYGRRGASGQILLSTKFTACDDVDLAALPVKPNESLLLRID